MATEAHATAPLANIVTLGVRDFSVERGFYMRLGWPVAFDSDDFVVFELRGMLLALFPVEQLATDARVQPSNAHDGIRFSIIINAENPQQVDDLIARFRNAGGKVTKESTAADFFDGSSAYISDPEGNYWEVAWAAGESTVLRAARRAAGLD